MRHMSAISANRNQPRHSVVIPGSPPPVRAKHPPSLGNPVHSLAHRWHAIRDGWCTIDGRIQRFPHVIARMAVQGASGICRLMCVSQNSHHAITLMSVR